MRRERKEVEGWEDERAGTFLEGRGRNMLFPILPHGKDATKRTRLRHADSGFLTPKSWEVPLSPRGELGEKWLCSRKTRNPHLG